jgi:hypothetical protein
MSDLNLSDAYLIGSDDVPVRAEISLDDGRIRCEKHTQGPASLVLCYPVDGVGDVVLETSRVVERDTPYNLQIELARGQLMRLDTKQEDWGLFDYPNTEKISERIRASRLSFINAVKETENPSHAAAMAEESLRESVAAGEQLARFHAELFLERRIETNSFGDRIFGCTLETGITAEPYRKQLRSSFDFVSVPMHWNTVEPESQEFNWKQIDAWVRWLREKKIPVEGGPLVWFHSCALPEWLYVWEHDFETVRDLVYEHIQQIVRRYAKDVRQWRVAAGLHVDNAFHFSFEQLMELTRMSLAATHESAPTSYTIVELAHPWGEYYARDQQTIPPMLYADMLVQSGIDFDAFGLQLLFGAEEDGSNPRDVMQISALLDRFAALGKTVHITAIGAPSATDDGTAGGGWGLWDEETQARWLQEVYRVVLSKPFVASLAWKDLSDQGEPFLPHGGLIRADFSNKKSLDAHALIRRQLQKSRGADPAGHES